MLFGKHRRERPSLYAHVGMTNACVGGTIAVSVQTAYYISRRIPAVVLAAKDEAMETIQHAAAEGRSAVSTLGLATRCLIVLAGCAVSAVLVYSVLVATHGF